MNRQEDGTRLLAVASLTKTYPDGAGAVRAVADVGFTVEAGEFCAVMGASGSGKSTLLHLIAALTSPDEGAIAIDGQDLFAMGDRARTLFRRENVGLVFQAFNLLPDLTGRDNIVLPTLLGGPELPEGEPDHVIDRLGLADCCARLPDAMSGGEQQRVAIARALVTRPRLLLADEPTGNLDSANSEDLCRLLRDLCREHDTTVLMVTHDPTVAFVADRLLIMRDGAVIEDVSRDAFADAGALARHLVESPTPVPVARASVT